MNSMWKLWRFAFWAVLFLVFIQCLVAMGDPVLFSGTMLEEDKPNCLEVTKYVPTGDGKNVLQTSLFYWSTKYTNENNQVVSTLDLSPEDHARLKPQFADKPVSLPGGATICIEGHHEYPSLGSPTLGSVRVLPRFWGGRIYTPQGDKVAIHVSPHHGVVTTPLIEIKGSVSEPSQQVTYDISNDLGVKTNLPGFITDEFYDTNRCDFTTNFFQCFDVQLAPGTNVVTLHFESSEGKMLTIQQSYILRLDLKTNAPNFKVTWPVKYYHVCGTNFTIVGRLADISSKVVAEIEIQGRKKVIDGIVERDGRFWIENIPVLEKTNFSKVVVTDVVGNKSFLEMTIVKSDDEIVIDPVPGRQLMQMQVTVTGTVSPPDRKVWVNGIQAEVGVDGKWVAHGVPVTEGGVAIFQAVVAPLTGPEPDFGSGPVAAPTQVQPVPSVSINSTFSNTNVILNASEPTYGSFQIHLAGAAGQSYVIESSTNLVDWSPIITNLNSKEVFDYSDTNMTMYGCRFFRIEPAK